MTVMAAWPVADAKTDTTCYLYPFLVMDCYLTIY